MERLVECVPNFSEGRKVEVVERLAQIVEEVEGAVVLDMHMDADHNRSVITFVAAASVVVEAALHVVGLAAQLIDLRHHTGQHPRVGATDVLPFIPVSGVEMKDCVALAHEAGARIWRELGIPVYFYERAALRPDRVNLEDVRRRGFEELRAQIEDPAMNRAPDIGEARVHEAAGAIVVGARPFLIAYNVNLQTDDITIARKVARAVRGRDGGLRYLKALGFQLASRGIVQVSMNLVNYEKTELHHAFEAVRREAARYGVQVLGSEIVGLVPQAALDRSAEHFLQIENFAPGLVLENRIEAAFAGKGERASVKDFVTEVTSKDPTPGGGAAAAHAASLGAALGEMIAHLTEGREKFADVQADVKDVLAELIPLRARLARTATEDAASFERVMEARRLPQGSEDERRERVNRIEEALKGAATVPLEVAGTGVQVLELLETLSEIGNPNALSDAATGAQLVLAAVASARYNVLVNTADIEDEEFAAEHRSRASDLLERAREIAARIEALLIEAIGSESIS
ncbi:MAG: glutamate formiminotransferase / formiminotetrahydrofolate cyclodeaminase [Acidobacteriota bacterium]|jgi:glutamate formiminotransferase/formiminotetrahydrofolate cyclodeaminase|nr:glutamate formiminotransferase / formiminotetrahydrofolate cyclodeaminase [Acidobacteriota bacterium]